MRFIDENERRIECKYNQNVMQKCKYRTACKTDIFESEPDVKKHADCSYDNGYDRILTVEEILSVEIVLSSTPNFSTRAF